jgi:hypothetical protein
MKDRFEIGIIVVLALFIVVGVTLYLNGRDQTSQYSSVVIDYGRPPST